jgi:NCS1 family nucleobase:cation symporter-1
MVSRSQSKNPNPIITHKYRDLIDAILTRYWSPSTRFACLLVAFGWSLSILGTNVAANMIPFGSDSTLLFPKYLTIPRGQFLVELLGFAICPWKILASASVFTTFLAGYGLFMASVVAIMVCDYFLLTKGNVFLSHAYDPTSSNKHYYYTRGWNIQAIIAYLCGVALPFPGFVGTLGASVSGSAQRLGDCGWMLSFVTSFVVYYVICCVVPTANQKLVKQMGLRWEEMADREIEVLGGVEEEYGMKPVATPSERNANGNGNGRSEKGVARQTMRPRTRTSDSR